MLMNWPWFVMHLVNTSVFSLSVLSCFGVIDCSQDKYKNDQKKPPYVYVFLLGDSENKCKKKCY